MKKINFLIPILGLSSIASLAIPMASCGCSQETTSHIVYRGAKHYAITAGDTVDINIVLDKIYTKEDIKSIELTTEVENFFSYTFDINDTVLTIHLKQTARVYEENKEYELDIKISTNSWTDAVKGIKFNYTLEQGTGLRAWAFEKTTMYCLNSGHDLHISYDNKNWDTIPQSGELQTFTIEAGKSIWLKGVNESGLNGSHIIFKNANTDRSDKPSIDLLGNINSLIYGDNVVTDKKLPDNAFKDLFYYEIRRVAKYSSTGINYVSDDFLPSTNLSEHCYSGLFQYCSNLLSTPKLPAQVLATYCYMSMFLGCGTLTTTTTLSAVKGKDDNDVEFNGLPARCYQNMFCRCTSLVVAPELPATVFGEGGCYASMFGLCESLVSAPKLPATKTLDKNRNIINGLPESSYASMFGGCTSLVNAPELPATKLGDSCYNDMFYRCTSLVNPPKLPAQTIGKSCYSVMFRNCSSLLSAPELPATKHVNDSFEEVEGLADNCYSSMFYCCENLKTAQELPAKIVGESSYSDMFSDCVLLEKAPTISATTLGINSCNSMFYNCISLTKAPDLPAETLEESCYKAMFGGCESLLEAPKIYAKQMAPNCCDSMFKNCKKLTTAPELNAMNLADYCYSNMFNGCSNLTQVPTLPATDLAIGCYREMFEGCTSLKSTIELPAKNLTPICYLRMFANCTSLTRIEKISPDNVAYDYQCCYSMFEGCTSLKVKMVDSASEPNYFMFTEYRYYEAEQFDNMFYNINPDSEIQGTALWNRYFAWYE